MDFKIKIVAITVAGLFIKWVVLRWFTQKMVDGLDYLIKKYLAKYPAEIAIWLHYQKKRKGLTHQHANPLVCEEEDCSIIQI